MKVMLILIMLVHGFIHLLGFLKAFDLAKIPALSGKTIILISAAGTRFLGILWLMAAILFLLTAISYIWDNKYWWTAGLAAVFLSQFLIILYWKDAKAGTIANVILLFPLIISLFTVQFNRETARQKEQLQNALPKTGTSVITPSDIETLPPVVQQWLRKSGVLGKQKISGVELKQQGEMLTKPGGKWMPFLAEQVFTVPVPAFVWEARIDMIPGVFIYGRDVFENGKGRMLIKPMAVFKIADAQGKETDQGTLLRYLAETCWFPSAALEPYITWETISDSSAKATMTYGTTVASGIFTYNKAGDVIGFEAMRYYEHSGKFSLEKWIVACSQHQEMNGIRIPVKSTVTWGLQSGDFSWLNLDITEINYSYQ
jgi:hypothetical protein